MNMPLHQISVIPAQDVTSSRVSRSKTKEKEEQVLSDTLFHRKLPKYKMIGVIRSDPILFQSPSSCWPGFSEGECYQVICYSRICYFKAAGCKIPEICFLVTSAKYDL